MAVAQRTLAGSGRMWVASSLAVQVRADKCLGGACLILAPTEKRPSNAGQNPEVLRFRFSEVSGVRGSHALFREKKGLRCKPPHSLVAAGLIWSMDPVGHFRVANLSIPWKSSPYSSVFDIRLRLGRCGPGGVWGVHVMVVVPCRPHRSSCGSACWRVFPGGTLDPSPIGSGTLCQRANPTKCALAASGQPRRWRWQWPSAR